MFYAWIFFENRFKDVYLPSKEKWSENIAIYQSESGWDRDYYITIRALDGQCYVSPPEKFHWLEPATDSPELPVENGNHYYMINGRFKMGIAFADCKKSDTCFKKFLLPVGKTISMGRGTECDLQIAPEIAVVSKRQGGFILQEDGSCIYTDSSRNGSYLNGLILAANSARLRFGDIMTLSAGIKFIYLGQYIAINRMSAFAHIGLTLAEPPVPAPRKENVRVPSVQIQHHRAPRFLQKPDTSDIKIEPPLDKQEQKNTPLWLTIGPSTTMVLPMLVGTAVSSANGTFMGSGLAMVGTASVLAVFWGLLNNGYRKKQVRETEEARVAKYALYIQQAEQYLRQISAQEYQRLLAACPNVEECSKMPQDNAYRLWERMPKHADFMSVRLGLGDVPLPNKIIIDDVKLSAIDDPLRDEPSRLADTYNKIKNAPVTINIRQETIIGILGTNIAASLAQSILLQLAALHSYHDVRVAVITGEGDQSRWSWARWLPHVFASEDRQLRMVVSEDNAIQEVLTHLDEILLMRDESAEESGGSGEEAADMPLPHYVVFCTKPELLESKPLLRHMLSKSWGMTLILLAPSMEVLPKECRIVLDASKVDGVMYYADGDVRNVDFEYPNQALLEAFSHMTAPLRVKDAVESAAIPTMVSFLDIYDVRRIEDLDIWRFWNENHVYEGIKATIGLRSGSQPFVLDISDKSHGPHGLVAGTTGSGKSVMLQTYILSLAVNYHPDQVRFILIDYKGGGMADTFRHLPHVTGIIDNLQTGNTIARALASIHGEIHRRERIFRKAGVSSIDDYIRFFYDDPAEERLPHLIIIVDEFAELKSDQPEFMQELISASRVGRSLGVHLILSTQKPSNSVSDEIWANSNFRICLRVQSRGDSMEMLRRPDAAYLKSKGRCYIQVGNDEIFEQAQTSYSGLAYNPDEPSETEMPHLLDNAGRLVSVKRPKPEGSIREMTQMDAVMTRIAQVAREHGIQDSRNLWMEELPSAIFLRNVPQSAEMERTVWAAPHTGMELRAVFAMGDDVLSQRQFPVWLDLMNNRNHMIVGMVSSGKTTCMQTLIMSFAMRYSPAAVQMYILSLSSRTLGCVSALPHVGEILYADETNELRRLLRLLEKENQRRQELFARASTDSFLEYNRACELNKKQPVPSIIVFVDRFAQLTEYLQDDDEFTQKLYKLIQEASARGIYFVVSAMKVSEIPYKIRDCFKGIGLQINDRMDYAEIVGMRMPSDMPDISSFAGRGLIQMEDRLFETQIALAGSSVSDVERAQELARVCAELDRRWTGVRPAGIPRIPERPTAAELMRSAEYREAAADPLAFSFAYSVDTGLPEIIDLAGSYSFLAVGGRQSGKTNFLRLMAKLWNKRGANIRVAADETWNEFCRGENLTRYDVKTPAWEEYVSWLSDEIKARAGKKKAAQASGGDAVDRLAREMEPVVIIIDDLESFITKNQDAVNRLFADVAKRAAKFAIYMYAAISHNAYAQAKTQEPLISMAKQQRGVALGGRLNECDPWNTQMPFSKKNAVFPRGEAYLINNGEVSHVVIPKSE